MTVGELRDALEHAATWPPSSPFRSADADAQVVLYDATGARELRLVLLGVRLVGLRAGRRVPDLPGAP